MTWERVKLETVADIIAGQSPPSSTYNTEGIGLPFYQGKTEFGDRFPTTRQWCSSPVKIAEAGDILISVRAPVGPTNLTVERSCIGRGLSAIRPSKFVDTNYLLHCLSHVSPELVKIARGSTFEAINQNDLRNLEIPLPPLHIQQQIAAVLDEVDALRQKRERSLEILARLVDATFIKQVGDPATGQYHFPNKPGCELYKLASGKFFKREDHSGAGKIPAYGGAGFTGWADFANFTGEAIVIGRVGFHCGNVNIIKAPTFITDNAIYTRELSNDINIDYLYHFLRLAKLNRFRDPGDLKKITQKPLDELLIPVPPLEVQNAIAKEIQVIEVLIAQAQASQENISSLLAAVQTQAFSGELNLRASTLS